MNKISREAKTPIHALYVLMLINATLKTAGFFSGFFPLSFESGALYLAMELFIVLCIHYRSAITRFMMTFHHVILLLLHSLLVFFILLEAEHSEAIFSLEVLYQVPGIVLSLSILAIIYLRPEMKAFFQAIREEKAKEKKRKKL